MKIDMELFDDPRLWVTLAFILLVILGYRKISTLLTRSLDDRSEKIRIELEQARYLREEAAAVLADYKKKQKEYAKEAETILLAARKDADILKAHAEKELAAAMEARTKTALDRIAQEESKAIADVRNHVVDIALASARNLIVDHIGTLSQEELVKLALTDIERKIH